MLKTNFPDKKFLDRLVKHMQDKVNASQEPLEKLLTSCSAAMNWVADYITDETINWTKETLEIDDLYLTGTNPEWNAIIIDRCQRSPNKLKELLKTDPKVAALFSKAEFKDLPILVRQEEEKYKVLDGMQRTIAAIRDGKKTIEAFVARSSGKFRPNCEPHVVYDLLRAYHRGINKDREGLVVALRFLRHSYANVENLLKTRFSKPYIPGDDEIQEIIREALKD